MMKTKNNYIILSKDIKDYNKGTRKNDDIYLLAYIKLCSNWETGESIINQTKLSELTGIPVSTIKNIISRLKDTSLIIVETKFGDGKRHNTYKFDINPINFFYIDTCFFHTTTPIRAKGFLLLLKSLCLNNSNKIVYMRSNIAKMLHQDRGAITKLINDCIQQNLLLELDKGFELPANYFPIYSSDKGAKKSYEQLNTLEGFVFNSIVNHCNKKGTMLFAPNLEPIKTIAAKYHQTQDHKDGQLNQLYLPTVLEKRCQNMPNKIESLNYFLKVLDLEYHSFSKEEITITL